MNESRTIRAIQESKHAMKHIEADVFHDVFQRETIT